MKLISSNTGKTLSFETIAGEKYNNLKFVSMPDADMVADTGNDPLAKHTQYWPYMTDGTPNDFRAYQYAKFIDSEKKPIYFGVPWIRESSIVENNSPATMFTFPAGTTADQIDNVRAMCLASGIEGFTVTTL